MISLLPALQVDTPCKTMREFQKCFSNVSFKYWTVSMDAIAGCEKIKQPN